MVHNTVVNAAASGITVSVIVFALCIIGVVQSVCNNSTLHCCLLQYFQLQSFDVWIVKFSIAHQF